MGGRAAHLVGRNRKGRRVTAPVSGRVFLSLARGTGGFFAMLGESFPWRTSACHTAISRYFSPVGGGIFTWVLSQSSAMNILAGALAKQEARSS